MIPKFSKALSVLVAGLFLAACEAPTTSTSLVPPSSPNAGPGPKGLTGNDAVRLFSEVCLATAPSYKTAPQALAKLPFVRNSRTKTYFHTRLNASFKITDNGCSFVAGGRKLNPVVDLASLLAADPTLKTKSRTPNKLGDVTYISVLRPKG